MGDETAKQLDKRLLLRGIADLLAESMNEEGRGGFTKDVDQIINKRHPAPSRERMRRFLRTVD